MNVPAIDAQLYEVGPRLRVRLCSWVDFDEVLDVDEAQQLAHRLLELVVHIRKATSE